MRARECVVAVVAVAGCGKATKELELQAARRAAVVELAAADVNKDGTLDVIVGYGPSMKDEPDTRFSTIEAFDGRTRKTLWTNRLPRFIVAGKLDPMPTVALNDQYVALTYTEDSPKPGGDFIGALSVHELATGRVRWQKTLFDTPHWVGIAFRVWVDGDQLLMLTDPRSSNGQVLRALDFASGVERWQQTVGDLQSMPVIVDNSYVMLSDTNDDHPHRVTFVDRHSGAVTHVALPSKQTVLGEDSLWTVCPSYDPRCKSVATDERHPRDVLVRVDLHTHAFTAVRPLNADLVDQIATYKDLVIEVNANQMVATRSGETKPLWTLDGIAIWTMPFSDVLDVPLEATHSRSVPARYLPALVHDGGVRIAVIDLETGTVTWKSKPFEITMETSFAMHGNRYFINIPAANAMLAFNGATGKLDGVFRIASPRATTFPNADSGEGRVYASDFQSGQLLGTHHGSEWWMIDLASGALVATPGVQLIAPWNDVERVLGPLPR